MTADPPADYANVRRAQYAGSWYDADAGKLATLIETCLHSVRQKLAPVKHSDTVMAVIAPHAGYRFSAQTAAFSYARAFQNGPFKRIFILGPAHQAALHGIALPPAEFFQTPLGNLSVDTETILELNSYPFFNISAEIHDAEHSLEMQLPFIKQTFGDVPIVPLLVGMLQGQPEVQVVAEILKNYIKAGDLIVVSSDFTHYGPRYNFVPFHKPFKDKVKQLDLEAVQHLSHLDANGLLNFQRRTADTICGLYPCAILSALLPYATVSELLKYSTSQEIMEDDTDNSVSYLALCFTGDGWPVNPQAKSAEKSVILSADDNQSLITLARTAIMTYARDGQIIEPECSGVTLTASLKQAYGTFVTIYKRSAESTSNLPEHKELRGCVGNIWPLKSLAQSIIDNAIAASSRDSRFEPLQPADLDAIDIKISILTPPRRVASYRDIVLGEHGIVISKKDKQAVFLPLVPLDFGWDLQETLRQLCLKAGLAESDWQTEAKFDVFRCSVVDA